MRVFFYHTEDVQMMREAWAQGAFPGHLLYGATHLADHGIEVMWHQPLLHAPRWRMMLHTAWDAIRHLGSYDAIYATQYRGIELLVLLRALRLLRKPIVIWHHQPVIVSHAWWREHLGRFERPSVGEACLNVGAFGRRRRKDVRVDAGLRQLWHEGWMHNRVRMVVASWLTKHMGIDWRQGAAWFMHTLVDADLANNAMGWQWVTGSGVDSAPYYRIFSPEGQAEKFDAQAYIRHWVPEFGRSDYPAPLVEHRLARERALAAHAALKG